MANFNNLIPVYLVSDADRLAVSEDNVLYMHMLRAKLESDIADMDMDFEESESQHVRTGRKLTRKDRRARRRVQNHTHKQSDRLHGKKRPMSRKDAVRANDDRAQMSRPVGMWSLYPNGACHFRPFQRSNRHNNHLSYGQEVLNMLKVASKRVTAEDVNWAKTVVQNAAEEGQEWAIHDYLAEQLDYCPTPEKEVALLTVILLSWWTEQFDGYISCGLPATEDCFDSISHSNWYRWAVRKKVPLMVEAWKQA